MGGDQSRDDGVSRVVLGRENHRASSLGELTVGERARSAHAGRHVE